MERIYDSSWFETFERNQEIQLKNFNSAVNEALKEDLRIKNSQHEDSKNQNCDSNDPPSHEIISYVNSLNFAMSANSGRAPYKHDNGTFYMTEERSGKQLLQNGNSSGISDSSKYQNSKSKNSLHSGQKEEHENAPFVNKCDNSLIIKSQECQDSKNSDINFLLPITPNSTLKSEFLRDDDDPYIIDIEKSVQNNNSQAYKIIKFFVPPKLPTEFLSALYQPKNIDAATTEKTLYCEQRYLYLQAKPLIKSIFEMNKFKMNAKDYYMYCQIESLTNRTLQGVLSSSLRISQARRENVRPLLKDKEADIYKKSLPAIESLFGFADIDLKKLRKTRCKKNNKLIKDIQETLKDISPKKRRKIMKNIPNVLKNL